MDAADHRALDRRASGAGHAVLDERYVGSIDKPEVATFSEEILQGAKAAFVMRKEEYGF